MTCLDDGGTTAGDGCSAVCAVEAGWEGLIAKYAPKGKRAHDIRLVAIMIEHHVPRMLTFNDADFAQFAEIAAVTPFDVLGIARV